MKSNTRVKAQLKRKTSPEIVSTIKEAKRQKAWLPLAGRLAGPARAYSSVDLNEIDAKTKEGDTVVVPGKVLGTGEISKKLRVCALGFSQSARAKLSKTKSEIVLIADEIKKNPRAQGIKIIT